MLSIQGNILSDDGDFLPIGPVEEPVSTEQTTNISHPSASLHTHCSIEYIVSGPMKQIESSFQDDENLSEPGFELTNTPNRGSLTNGKLSGRKQKRESCDNDDDDDDDDDDGENSKCFPDEPLSDEDLAKRIQPRDWMGTPERAEPGSSFISTNEAADYEMDLPHGPAVSGSFVCDCRPERDLKSGETNLKETSNEDEEFPHENIPTDRKILPITRSNDAATAVTADDRGATNSLDDCNQGNCELRGKEISTLGNGGQFGNSNEIRNLRFKRNQISEETPRNCAKEPRQHLNCSSYCQEADEKPEFHSKDSVSDSNYKLQSDKKYREDNVRFQENILLEIPERNKIGGKLNEHVTQIKLQDKQCYVERPNANRIALKSRNPDLTVDIATATSDNIVQQLQNSELRETTDEENFKQVNKYENMKQHKSHVHPQNDDAAAKTESFQHEQIQIVEVNKSQGKLSTNANKEYVKHEEDNDIKYSTEILKLAFNSDHRQEMEMNENHIYDILQKRLKSKDMVTTNEQNYSDEQERYLDNISNEIQMQAGEDEENDTSLAAKTTEHNLVLVEKKFQPSEIKFQTNCDESENAATLQQNEKQEEGEDETVTARYKKSRPNAKGSKKKEELKFLKHSSKEAKVNENNEAKEVIKECTTDEDAIKANVKLEGMQTEDSKGIRKNKSNETVFVARTSGVTKEMPKSIRAAGDKYQTLNEKSYNKIENKGIVTYITPKQHDGTTTDVRTTSKLLMNRQKSNERLTTEATRKENDSQTMDNFQGVILFSRVKNNSEADILYNKENENETVKLTTRNTSSKTEDNDFAAEIFIRSKRIDERDTRFNPEFMDPNGKLEKIKNNVTAPRPTYRARTDKSTQTELNSKFATVSICLSKSCNPFLQLMVLMFLILMIPFLFLRNAPIFPVLDYPDDSPPI